MIPPRIESIEILSDFKIKIFYVNGEMKIYDINKLFKYDFYKKLRQVEYFKLAKSVGTTIEWPEGEDVDPNELYNNSVRIDDFINS